MTRVFAVLLIILGLALASAAQAAGVGGGGVTLNTGSAVDGSGQLTPGTCLTLRHTDGTTAQQWCPVGTNATRIKNAAGSTLFDLLSTGSLSGTSFVASAASGNPGLTIESGARLCFDGSTCAQRMSFDGTYLQLTSDFAITQSSGTLIVALSNTGGGASSMYFLGGGSYFGYDNSFNIGTASFVGGPITSRTEWDANGVMSINAGLKLADPGARPTCDSSTRGRIHYEAGGAGVADTVEMCGKSAADAYDWQALATF